MSSGVFPGFDHDAAVAPAELDARTELVGFDETVSKL